MKRSVVLSLAVLAALPSSAPAQADQALGVKVTQDVGGDANGINNQSQETVPDPNLSTAPASIDSADLREIALETRYQTVKDRDEAGRVLAVRYVPDALRIHFTTTAPAKPSFGPGVIFRMSATIGDQGCQVQFELWVPGSAPNTSTAQRAEVNRLRNCTGGSGFLSAGFSVAFQGATATATYPFEFTQGLLEEGGSFSAYTRPHSRVVVATSSQYVATVPAIDQMPAIGGFVVGQDVPEDVDCLATPDHPDCA